MQAKFATARLRGATAAPAVALGLVLAGPGALLTADGARATGDVDLFAGAGPSRSWVPQFGAGTRIDPLTALESAIAVSPDRLDGHLTWGGVRVGLPGQGLMPHEVYGRYQHGRWTGSSSGSVPIGVIPVAITNLIPHPDTGSTGIVLGSTGADVRIRTKVESDRGNVDFRWSVPWIADFFHELVTSDPPQRTEFSFVTGWHGEWVRRNDSVRQTSSTFDGISSDRDLSVREDFNAVKLGGRFDFNRRTPQGLFASIGGYVAPGHLTGRGTARQHVLCNLCPPTEQDFTLTLRERNSTTAVKAGAEATLGYAFNSQFRVLARAWYDHINKAHVWDVPITPDMQPAVLRTGSREEAGIGGRVIFPVSDRRLKRDVALIARLDSGIKLYRYRYLWSDTEHVGVMAQEVAQVMPEAVARGADSFLHVDYARLGLRPVTLDAWRVRTAESPI